MIIDEIKYIKGRKSIGIQVKDGRVYVRAPKSIPNSKLNSVLKDKEDWINKKLAEYNSTLERHKDIIEYRRFLFSGEEFDFSGLYRIVFKKMIPKGAELKKLEREYRKFAAQFLSERLNEISGRSGLPYGSLKLTRSKAKWGSCNNKGVITLNWRLIMLPNNIIEYIILHELCHLKNMDHSKEYWQTLSKYCADINAAKQYLKANNFIIKLF